LRLNMIRVPSAVLVEIGGHPSCLLPPGIASRGAENASPVKS
jgi:hypothetical protein